MKLKTEQITANKVSHIDLNNFIEKHYKVEYNLAADQQCGNDVWLKFSVKKEELDEYGHAELADFLDDQNREDEEGSSFILSTILTDLCNKGMIDEGDLFIEVSW